MRKEIIVLVLGLLLASCSNVIKKPQPPTVSVVGVKPLTLSVVAPRLQFNLKVENPNGFDLPIQRIRYVMQVAGQEVAKGEEMAATTIPANGSGIVPVSAEVRLGSFMQQLSTVLQRGQIDLTYNLQGRVNLDNWPTAIPFKKRGSLIPTLP